MSAVLIVLATIAFIGDSITVQPGGYADRPGSERYVWYHLADAIVLLDTLPTYDYLVIELGTHAVNGSDRLLAADDEQLFRYYYGRLIRKALKHGRRVIIINIPWTNWGPKKADLAQRYNAIIAEVAKIGKVRVVDAYGILESCGMDCIGEDGFHPNALGHRLLRFALFHQSGRGR